MPNSEEPQTVFQEIVGFKEERSAFARGRVATMTRGANYWSRFLSHEWSSASLFLFPSRWVTAAGFGNIWSRAALAALSWSSEAALRRRIFTRLTKNPPTANSWNSWM